MEILQTIALLCHLGSSGGGFSTKIEEIKQLKCQQHYLKCVGKASLLSDRMGNLEKCVKERKL